MIDHREAAIVFEHKETYTDGSIVEMVIWGLPGPTVERPHGYKYRLNYCLANGEVLVRFDNKAGKGDHKHIGATTLPYQFISVDTLLADFEAAVLQARGLI